MEKKYRLHQIALELDVNLDTLVDVYLNNLNYNCEKNLNSKIPLHIYESLIKKYGNTDSIKKIVNEASLKTEQISKNSKTNLITFKKLFENNIFRIPDYQRGYSWSKKELEDLWSDLLNLSGSSFHFTGIITLEPVSDITRFRFEKEIIFVEKINSKNEIEINETSYSPYFIVDGQQRLTTLIILLAALHDLAKKDKINIDQDLVNTIFYTKENQEKKVYKFGYEKDTPSYQYLLAKILNDSDTEITEPETIYTKNLLDAKKFFTDKLNDLLKTNYLLATDIFNKITNNLLFNMLVLDSNQVDISMVFETLNYRGKSLSKLEILKNRIIYLTSKVYKEDNIKYIEIRENITKTWLQIYKWLGKGKNTFSQIDDDNFLRAFWILYFNHDENKSESSFNKFESDLFDNRFKINDINNNKILKIENLNNFLKEIESAVKAWYYINYPEKDWEDEMHVNNEFVDYLQRLNKISQGNYIQPLIMAMLIRKPEKEFENLQDEIDWKLSLIKEIERHNVVLFFINGKSNDTNRAYCYRLTNQFYESRKDGRTFHKTKEYLKKSINKHHSIFNFINHIHHNRANNQQFWDWNGKTYILWLYETNLSKTENSTIKDMDEYSTYSFYKLNNVDLKFESLKKSKKDSSMKIENSLGNIFLKLNKKNNNGEEKYTLNEAEYLIKLQDWNLKLILERGSKILNFIESTYNIKLGTDDNFKRLLINGVRDN
jgi:uncharacterized protein with ParB-like and HNH nuclease domain